MSKPKQFIPIQREPIQRESRRSTNQAAQQVCRLQYSCSLCAHEPTCTLDKKQHNQYVLEQRLAPIGQIILVLANKGGVGKSTISANLAAGLATRGFSVGVADADIHGPNQSRFFGMVGAHTRLTDDGLQPLLYQPPTCAQPIRIGSLAFLMQDDHTPVVWRDAYKHDFIHHLLGSFDWQGPEFLIIDMPPGTGNELITLADLLQGHNTAAILVTTSQEVAQMDSLKAAHFCQERQIPLIGAVENMAGIQCPHCQGEFHLFPRHNLEQSLAALNIPSLATLPLAPELAQYSDEGRPITAQPPTAANAPLQKAFAPLIQACIDYGQANFSRSVSHGMDEVFAQNLQSEHLQQALQNLDGANEAVAQELKAMLSAEAQRLHQASQHKRSK